VQKFLSKYALAAHLALLAVAPLLLFPFFGPSETAVVLIWMSLMTAFWLFLEPSRRVNEYLYNARRRVFKSVFADPLFWIFFLFVVIAVIRWLNAGISLVFDLSGDNWNWVVTAPKIPWLPGSSGDAGFFALATLIAVMTSVLTCRHALGKSARTMVVFLSSFFAAIAALVAILRLGASVAYDGSFAGSAFGIFFLASIAALAGMFEAGWNRAFLLFSFAVGGTFVGLWYFAPKFIVAFYSVAGVVLALIAALYVAVTKGISAFFKFVVALIIAAAIPLAMIKIYAPPELVEAKSAILTFNLFSADYYETRKMYGDVAAGVWRDGNIWHGAGIGYLPLFIEKTMAESAWVSSVPHGWWQLLAERGFIGLGMFVLPFAVLLFLLVRRLIAYGITHIFWPFLLLGVSAVSVVVCEGFYDVSFTRAEVLVPSALLFTLSLGSIPPKRSEKDNNQ
jgi:hypothetical protein